MLIVCGLIFMAAGRVTKLVGLLPVHSHVSSNNSLFRIPKIYETKSTFRHPPRLSL